jgi:hypothetical protein
MAWPCPCGQRYCFTCGADTSAGARNHQHNHVATAAYNPGWTMTLCYDCHQRVITSWQQYWRMLTDPDPASESRRFLAHQLGYNLQLQLLAHHAAVPGGRKLLAEVAEDIVHAAGDADVPPGQFPDPKRTNPFRVPRRRKGVIACERLAAYIDHLADDMSARLGEDYWLVRELRALRARLPHLDLDAAVPADTAPPPGAGFVRKFLAEYARRDLAGRWRLFDAAARAIMNPVIRMTRPPQG